jgi:hypothetical protein
MNLPVVIDIAIGLIFIYLILSLLTSEIQELITILLQWRAEHLKRSIENLIAGEAIDDPVYQDFTDELYSSPLIKTLNQEAKGLLAVSLRQIIRFLTGIVYTVTKTQSVFRKQRSAPSYIPADTFATALLQTLNIKELSLRISELTVQQFAQDKLAQLQTVLDDLAQTSGPDSRLAKEDTLLDQEYQRLRERVEVRVAEFVGDRSAPAKTLDQITEQFLLFFNNLEQQLVESPRRDVIRRHFSYLKQTMTHRQLEPTVSEILHLLFEEDITSTKNGTKLTPWVRQILTTYQKENPDLLRQVKRLPDPLQRSLLSLAEQARQQATSLQDEVKQLEQAVATWFDNGMERASGVYKRNAKGIAILIGFLFAIATNADTFYMVSRLSKDSLIRSTIGQAADQVVISTKAKATPNTKAELEDVKTAVDAVLDEMPLPVGWNQTVVDEQGQEERRGWRLPIPQRAIGWLITGIALSMGAAFWYDILSRVMQVRGTGRKPEEK